MTDIEQYLAHRPPFLFVDELLTIDADGGRFVLRLGEGDPRLQDGALPPLYLVEALAQSAAAFNGHERPGLAESGLLVEITATFSAPARAGEQVDLEVRRVRMHGQLARFHGEASVSGRILCEAELTVMRGLGGLHV